MRDWTLPFAPPIAAEVSYPIPQAVQVWGPQSYQLAQEPVWDLFCDQCGSEIEEGARTVELFDGIAGRGQKSGRAMVVDGPDESYMSLVTLHHECVMDFVFTEVNDDEIQVPDDHEVYCAGCEAKLSGED